MEVIVKATQATRAVYLRGDPGEAGPIPRGRLWAETDGLHFSDPGGADMRIEINDMRGITVSGRRPDDVPGRVPHGMLRVASQNNGHVDLWEFAVDRHAAAALRDTLGAARAARQEPPLPFVEQILGPASETSEFVAIKKGDVDGALMDGGRKTDRRRRTVPSRPRPSTPQSDTIRRRRLVAAGFLAGGALITAEIVLPLLLSH
jgi:hypothetical protein